MKKYLLVLTSILVTVTAVKAQKYGATPEDSTKCVQNLSLYREFYKQKNYDDALKNWRMAFNNCPKASKKMYVDGLNIIEYKIENAADEKKEDQYIDTLLMIYDQRIEHFGQEGYVLGRKGLDMLKHRSSKLEEAYATLDKSIQLRGVDSEAGALAGYFTALVYMEKRGKKEEADVVKGFNQAMNIIGEHIDDPKYGKYYERAQSNIQKMAGPYLSCEVIIPLAEKNYEKNKENEDWLIRMAGLMNDKECTETDIYARIAEAAFELKPSAAAAGNMGKVFLTNKEYEKAAEYYNMALEMEKEEKKKFNYYLGLTQVQMAQGQYSSARSTAYKAAEANPESGYPYMLIGDMYAASAGGSCGGDDAFKKSTVYWAAVDKYMKAKSVDKSLATQANQKIATYSKYFPEKSDAFFQGLKNGDSYKVECWIGETTTVRTKD